VDTKAWGVEEDAKGGLREAPGGAWEALPPRASKINFVA